MKIVIGLGNPGKEYEKTRHNVGWLFLEYLENTYDFKVNKKLQDSLICETVKDGEKLVFVKPQTYMNLSGNAVQKIKKWYKVNNEDILIVFDDIDIEFGSIRYKENGSGGTHNGMKNIIQMLGSNEIPRIKIGIGGLRREHQDLSSFVLEKFSKQELNELQSIFTEAEEKMNDFLDKSKGSC